MGATANTGAVVTLIHGTPLAIPPLLRAFSPVTGLHLLHQVDEGLLWEIERRGGLTSKCVARMELQLTLASLAGSTVAMTTCNAYSMAVIRDLAPRFSGMHVLTVDEPMIRFALNFPRVAVVGTNAAGLQSQREVIDYLSADLTHRPSIAYFIESDAFVSLSQGDTASHDAAVLSAVDRALDEADVVMLAQASMARVLPAVPVSAADRVLGSPARAAESVARLISALPSASAVG